MHSAVLRDAAGTELSHSCATLALQLVQIVEQATMDITSNECNWARGVRSQLSSNLTDRAKEELHQAGLLLRLQKLLADASAKSHILSGYIYGSVLRDDFDPRLSDIDLLIVVKDARDGSSTLFVNALPSEFRQKADVSILTDLEVSRRLHPGWSAQYFFNVKSSGICFHGLPVLEDIDKSVLSMEQVAKRVTNLAQRSRFVLLNPRKHHETAFWLAKYQYWVPLCLMELLAIHGIAEFRVRRAHDRFLQEFPHITPQVHYPYSSLDVLQDFLEHLSVWVTETCTRKKVFGTIETSGSPQGDVSFITQYSSISSSGTLHAARERSRR